MHPFTSLALWVLAACTTLTLPTQTILPAYNATTFFCLTVLKVMRQRAKYIVWLTFSLGAGLGLAHGGWPIGGLNGVPRPPERWAHAVTLWLRILAIVLTSQLGMQYVPVQCFIHALFASRLPSGVAYLFTGLLLVVEQLKRQLATIHEAQRARGMPLSEGWYQRLRMMPALVIPLTYNALNDLAVRDAVPDMRVFGINNRRTTLWASANSTLQHVVRYTMILLMLAEFGVWVWLC